jgi:WD40 repeat protein
VKRAGELIERFAARRPLAVRLAEAVSLAVLADPRLLRRARLDLVPEADPGTEADLWLSPLVQTRSPDGLVFAAEVSEALRARLAADSARLETAWRITRKMHRHLTPALRLEEEIAFLSLTSESDPRAAARIEELLRSALAAVVAGEMRGLAHWAARALPKLPSRVRVTQAARLLEAGAHLRLGGATRPLRNSQEILDSPWMAPADLPRVPVGVRLFPDAVELDARPDPPGQHLMLPQTDPLLVELSWQDPARGQREARQVTFRKGEMHRIEVPAHDLRLRTVLGEVYDLRAAGTAPRGVQDWIIDFSEELARHRPFFGRMEERLKIGRVIREDISDLAPGRLVLVTGATGTGKTALLAQFVGSETPHHFFRRGQDLEDVGRAERSLLGQIVRRFGELAVMATHQGLQEVLSSLSERGLVTSETGPLVLVLDGMDEARSADGTSDGLLGLLAKGHIPDGVVILASTASDQELDLPGSIENVPLTDAEPFLREYWGHYLGKERAESFIQFSTGNFGVAEVLRSWMEWTQRKSFTRTSQGGLMSIWEELGTLMAYEVRDSWLGALACAFQPLPSSLFPKMPEGEATRQALGSFVSSHETGPETVYEIREEVLRTFVSTQLDRMEIARPVQTVFLSSTTRDLQSYRNAVHQAIERLDGYRSMRMEDFAARPTSVEASLAREIAECDIFVGLVGFLYGSQSPGSELSYTALELEEAKKLGKPVLLFVAKDDLPLSPNLRESDEIFSRQMSFRQRIMAENVVGFFQTPDDLALKVMASLSAIRRGSAVNLFHRRLAEATSAAIFAGDSTEQALRYSLRHAADHWLASGDLEKAIRLLTRIDYLASSCRRLGVPATCQILRRWLEKAGQTAYGKDDLPQSLPPNSWVVALTEILAELGVQIEDRPEDLPSLLFDRLRLQGLESRVIEGFLKLSPSSPFFRLSEPIQNLRNNRPVRHRSKVTGCAFVDLNGPAVLSWSTDGTLRVWDVKNGDLKVVLSGHTAEITGCVPMPDERAVSASRDCTLRLWDTRTGSLVRTMWGHEGEILGVLALDEQRVVSWSADRTLRVWDLTAGREVMVLRGHEGAVTACAKTARQRYLVSGSDDTTVRIWDLSSGALIRTERGHIGAVTCVAAPEGHFVYSGSLDRTLRVWSLEREQHTQVLEGHTMGILSCAVSPNNLILATCSYDHTIQLWRLPGGKARWDEEAFLGDSRVHPLAILTGHEGAVLSCAFFSEGDRLVSCSADRTVRIRDVQTGEAVAVLRGHDAAVRSMAIRSRQSLTDLIASAADDRTIRIWDAQDPGEETILDGNNATLFCLPFQDRQRVVTFSRLGDLRIHHVDDPVPGWIGSPSMSVGGGILTPDERRLILWSRGLVDGNVRFSAWDLAAQKEVAEFYAHDAPILACAVTPDGTTLLTASLDGTVRNFSLVNWIEMPVIEEKSPVSALAAAVVPSIGRLALRGLWDGTVVFWIVDRSVRENRFTGHTDRVLACAFAPGGLRAVSASADQTLRLWNLQTGSAVAVLTGHTAEVTGCAFTRDGRRIVSRSKDGRLGLWDGESGQLIAFTQGHTDWVNAFALDEEAGLVYSASEDQSVRAWDLATGEPRGVVYGVSPFRSLAAVQGGVYAGDEAGNLWPLESTMAPAPREAA